MKSYKSGKMQTLLVEKAKTESKVAQCCAKISVVVAGCHD